VYKIDLVCAARPNFMKIAPLYHALRTSGIARPRLIHTGQHYDPLMSDVFFQDFELPAPDIHLNVGSGTHAEQTAKVMMAYEKVAIENPPDAVIVAGDVNSSMAVAITAKKIGLFVAHLEAGLRSQDRRMPEELNRIVIDALADLLWTPSEDADENLLREGVAPEKIAFTGNIMIDAYCLVKDKILTADVTHRLGLGGISYLVATLHRPSNVDDPVQLLKILESLQETGLNVIFPVHPRTRKNIEQFKIALDADKIKLCDPMGYVDFMSLVSSSVGVITDSGGIQEETTYLGIPCFTLRESTERPITISMGTNQLVSAETLLSTLLRAPKTGMIPPLWDGKTADRVLHSLYGALENKSSC